MIMEVLPTFLSSVVWYLCKPSSSDFTVQSTFGTDWKTFLVARTLGFIWVAPSGSLVGMLPTYPTLYKTAFNNKELSSPNVSDGKIE